MAGQAARFDWLADLAGASALGLAAGYAASKLSPSLALDAAFGGTALAGAAFGFGLLAMWSVAPTPRVHALPELRLEPLGTGELLLDCPVEEPLLLDELWEPDVLLLEDRLTDPEPSSRVVQLFSAGAGREARPSGGRSPQQAPDATSALYAALAELRRSLR